MSFQLCHLNLFVAVQEGTALFFLAVINDLIEQGRLSGAIQGRHDKANFVPDIYSRTQNAWVDAFYQQNGYLGRSWATPRLLFDSYVFLPF
jgi:hypothetical protein